MYKLIYLLFSSFILSEACHSGPPIRDEDIDTSNTQRLILKRDVDFYFILEKIETKKQWEFWNGYNQTLSYMSTSRMKDECGKEAGLIDAASIFREAIKCQGVAWVAYAATKDFPLLEWEEKKNIELAFAVLTQPDIPFQIHRGISRNEDYTGPQHPSISLDLHAFAARAMRKINPLKRYVISDPLEKMREIFIKNLPSQCYQNGFNFEGSWTKMTMIEQLDVNTDRQNPFHPFDYAKFNFSLFTEEGKDLFCISGVEESAKYSWFLKKIRQGKYFIININLWLAKT